MKKLIIAVIFIVALSNANMALADNIAPAWRLSIVSKSEKIAHVNEKAEALMLEKRYREALEILEASYKKDIYDNQTIFLIGFIQRELGDYNSSIKFFEKLLEEDPNGVRVRFELAISYIKSGKFDEARPELIIVQKSNPPTDILEVVTKLLAQINVVKNEVVDNVDVHKTFFGSLSIGALRDDNINYATSNNKIQVGQFLFTPEKSIKGTGETANGLIGYNKVLNKKYGVSGIFYGSITDYLKSQNNNYDMMSFYTGHGVNFYGKQSKLYVPLVYSALWIDSSEFSRSPYLTVYGTNPSVAYKFNKIFSTETTVGNTKKEFRDLDLQERNSNIYSLSNAFNFELGSATFLSFSLGTSDERAKLRAYSNTSYNGSVLISQGFFSNKIITSAVFSRSNTNYKGEDPLFGEIRHDKFYSIKGAISYIFMPQTKITLSDTYSKNNSNFEAFDYNKNVISLTVTRDF